MPQCFVCSSMNPVYCCLCCCCMLWCFVSTALIFSFPLDGWCWWWLGTMESFFLVSTAWFQFLLLLAVIDDGIDVVACAVADGICTVLRQIVRTSSVVVVVVMVIVGKRRRTSGKICCFSSFIDVHMLLSFQI